MAACAALCLLWALSGGGVALAEALERADHLRLEAEKQHFGFEGATALAPDTVRLPVGWLQYTDSGWRHFRYPSYFVVEHVVDPALARHQEGRDPATENKCVVIRTSGGRIENGELIAGRAAMLRRTPRPVDPAYAYEVRGYVRSVIDGKHRFGPAAERRTTAGLRLEWLGAGGDPLVVGNGAAEKPLFTEGEPTSFGPGDSGWREFPELRINDVPPGARLARLWVVVASTDRDASVYVDDLSMVRRPRAILVTGRASNVYPADGTINVQLQFKGISATPTTTGFRRVIEATDLHGERALFLDSILPPASVRQHLLTEDLTLELSRLGPVRLKAELYRIEADGTESRLALRQIRMGRIVPYRPKAAGGEVYGVELAPDSPDFGEAALEAFDALGLLLMRVGLWRDAAGLDVEPSHWQGLDVFLGRFGRKGGRLVAVMDYMAPGGTEREGGPGMAEAVTGRWDLFEKCLSAAVGRFQFYVDSWQIGPDGDGSFAGGGAAEPVVARTREFLRSRAELKKICVPWPLARVGEIPTRDGADAYTVVVPAEADPKDLFAIAAGRGGKSGELWLVLEPRRLDDPRAESKEQAELAQASDLAKKLIVARCAGVKRAFVSRFTGEKDGLISSAGPNASFYALSTCSRLLAGSEYLGFIDLAAGVRGYLFRGADGSGLMAVWAASEGLSFRPLYLGDPASVRTVDLFGNESTVPTTSEFGAPLQDPEVDETPIFLTGLDVPLMMTRRSARFGDGEVVQSRFSPQTVKLRVENHLGSASEIRITPSFPRGWRVRPSVARVTLAPGGSSDVDLSVRPGFGEALGAKEVFIEMRFHDRAPIRITRTIDLVSDVTLMPEIVRRSDGSLEVRVKVRSDSAASRPVDLVVYVDMPGRPRKRGSISGLPPGGQGGLSVPIMLDPADDGAPIRIGAQERGGDRFVNIEGTVGRFLRRRGSSRGISAAGLPSIPANRP